MCERAHVSERERGSVSVCECRYRRVMVADRSRIATLKEREEALAALAAVRGPRHRGRCHGWDSATEIGVIAQGRTRTSVGRKKWWQVESNRAIWNLVGKRRRSLASVAAQFVERTTSAG